MQPMSRVGVHKRGIACAKFPTAHCNNRKEVGMGKLAANVTLYRNAPKLTIVWMTWRGCSLARSGFG
jgi:hypothetical protein